MLSYSAFNPSNYEPSPYVKKLKQMPLASFAQAVRDIPPHRLEELSEWCPGTDPKALLVNERLERMIWDQSEYQIGSDLSDEEGENVTPEICSHERHLSSKRRSAVKCKFVKQKLHQKHEAAIAQKCGHASGYKSRKPRIAASPKVEQDDVVEPNDLWLDVYFEHYDDQLYEWLLQMAELQENEPVPCERPGPWDLNLKPYIDDMYEEICGSWYDSDESLDESLVALYMNDSDEDW
jgi:hypothetical protein